MVGLGKQGGTMTPVNQEHLAYGMDLLTGGQIERVQTEHYAYYRCKCTTKKEVKRTNRNGVVVVGYQCAICGCFEQTSKGKRSVESFPEFVKHGRMYHDAISALRALRSSEFIAEREEENQQWWSTYNDYLRSPQWQSKRRKVLQRAGGVCECCLERHAAQVHHTTYQHVGNEPLWELRAICNECHESLTEQDRSRRSA